MTIKDREFTTFIDADELNNIVRLLADRINHDYSGSSILACPVLTGAYMFAADLLRQLSVPCEVHFVKYTSYEGTASTGVVDCAMPFPAAVKGRNVLIVEDVVDSGISMQHMLHHVQALHPLSVRICSLFFKPHAFKSNFKVDYIGREIGNEFIVGYGMDYDGLGRTLPHVLVEKNNR